ncbi:hypothetical protein Patl1_36702 [Pistacia atlantica]|nr:hypothetical protein Patl1_36702 [Pistacia atlantica]
MRLMLTPKSSIACFFFLLPTVMSIIKLLRSFNLGGNLCWKTAFVVSEIKTFSLGSY